MVQIGSWSLNGNALCANVRFAFDAQYFEVKYDVESDKIISVSNYILDAAKEYDIKRALFYLNYLYEHREINYGQGRVSTWS